jgi:hypothetical protein
MSPENYKPKFKIKFDEYYHQLNFGFNFCYDRLNSDCAEYYAIFHFGKYYLVIGVMI